MMAHLTRRRFSNGGEVLPKPKPKLPQIKLYVDKLKTYLEAGAIEPEYAIQLLQERMKKIGFSNEELAEEYSGGGNEEASLLEEYYGKDQLDWMNNHSDQMTFEEYLQWKRAQAAQGGIIGKPGGLVEPGVMYYGKTYKLREGATTTKIVEHLGDPATAGEVNIDEIRKKFYDDDITDAEIRKRLKKKGYKTSKVPVDDVVEFAIKKSGIKNPEFFPRRKNLQKLYEVIQKYNEMDDITKVVGKHVRDVSEADLLKEAGYGGGETSAGRVKAARYLIDEYFLTTNDKIKRDLTKLLSSPDTKLSDAVDFTQKMSKKYNKPLNSIQKDLRKFPLWQKNQALVKRLTSHNYTQKFKNHKNFDLMTLGDFIDESNIRANFSLNVADPEGQLQAYAYRHYNQEGDKIKFLTDPHKTPQSDWVFKYKGPDGKWTTYDKSSLALSKNDSNFKSFWKTDAQVAKYNNHIVDDPAILKKLGFNKPTSMRNIMARTLGYGTGAEGYYKVSPLDKDHVDLVNDPFEVRPMDTRINRGAGHLKKELLRGNLTKEQYDQAMKKIGYEYKGKIDFDNPQQFDNLIKRDLDFSLKTKLRSKGYLQTPSAIAKQFLKRIGKTAVKTIPIVGTTWGTLDAAETKKRGLTDPDEIVVGYHTGPDVAQWWSDYKEKDRNDWASTSLLNPIKKSPADEEVITEEVEETEPKPLFGKYANQIKDIKIP